MKTRALALFALLALLGVSLAAAAKIRSGHDPAVDFAQMKTYRWKVAEGPGDPDLDIRIRRTAREELAKKGLRELPPGNEPADLLLVYSIGGADTLASGFRVEAGWYGDLVAVPAGVSRISAGIALELQRPDTEKAVWAASYVMTGNNPQSLQVMRDRVEKAVRGALGKYPPR